MNTNAMLKQLKEKLNSLEEIIKLEHERLTTVLEGIELVENKVREEYNRCVWIQDILDRH